MALLYKRLTIWVIAILAILMIPLIAMQFTSEVNWSIPDFLLMGSILFAVGLSFELIARRGANRIYKTAFAIGLLGAFLLFWINAAVGIIGSENQTVNLLFGATFLVGFIGSTISKFKAKGMSTTLFVAAIVQILTPVFAYLIFPPPSTSWSPGIAGVFLLSSFFAVIFLISGILFRKAV